MNLLPLAIDSDLGRVYQIILPDAYRQQVLALAHDSTWFGHLGITKTYDQLLKHFFWPGLKSSVAQFCKSCHVCQLVGKPNQVVPPAPLHPIPVIGEPFEHVIVDCVGPLPKTKSGNQFLLTIMCAATQFPEAVPLRNITAKAVKALTKFYSTFGLPKTLQTDQGSNFFSKIFKQVLQLLCITRKVLSAFHTVSQGVAGALAPNAQVRFAEILHERRGNNWDEGVPFAHFALRETRQDSLGF